MKLRENLINASQQALHFTEIYENAIEHDEPMSRSLLDTVRYLVWHPQAIIVPVLLSLISTAATPTVLVRCRTVASISTSSYVTTNEINI